MKICNDLELKHGQQDALFCVTEPASKMCTISAFLTYAAAVFLFLLLWAMCSSRELAHAGTHYYCYCGSFHSPSFTISGVQQRGWTRPSSVGHLWSHTSCSAVLLQLPLAIVWQSSISCWWFWQSCNMQAFCWLLLFTARAWERWWGAASALLWPVHGWSHNHPLG